MQLLGCHIEGFGKLVNFERKFTEGINGIEKENGWGKSTLATFIRVMFFGFENEGKRDDISNERKRYIPWNKSAIYGGSLWFQIGEKKYRIERYFDEKKASKDKFFLYDEETKLNSDDYSTNIGEELFEIDRESFRKTIFIGQKETGAEATARVSAKIGDIADWVEDLGNYEVIEKKLKEELNAITPDRKTGEIKKIQLRLEELYGVEEEKRRKEKRLLEIERSLLKEKEGIQEKEKALGKIREKMKEESLYNEEKIIVEKQKDFLEKKKELEEQRKELEKEFKGEIPDLEEIDQCMEALQKREILAEKRKENALTEEEQKKRGFYRKKFLNGVPTQEDLFNLEKQVRRLKEIKAVRIGKTLSETEIDDFERLQKKFQKYIPDRGEIEKHILDFEELDGKKRNLLERREEIRELERKQKEKKKKKNSFFLFGGSLFLTGLMALFFNFYLAFFIMFMGFSCFLLGVITKTGNKDEIERLQEEKRREEEWIQKKQKELCDFLDYFSLPYTEEGKLRFFYELKEDLVAFYALKGRKKENEKLAGEELEILEEIRKSFSNFGVCNISEYELEQGIHKIKMEMGEVEEIRNKEKKEREAQREEEERNAEITSFFNRNGIVRKQGEKAWLRELRDRVLMIQNVKKMEVELERKKVAFLEENRGFDFERNRDGEHTEAIGSLNEEFHRLSEERKSLYEKRSEIEKEVLMEEKKLEELQTMVEEKRELLEKKQELQHRYEILKKTKEYLERAKVRFVARYVSPIQNSFLKYYNMMTEDGREFELDANLSFSFREGGEKKDILLLSEGYQNMVGMGRRMAMIDAMYKEEKPFLIMDDPFVNLDGENLQRAKSFLKEISKNYQVLYFYCHESRRPEEGF